MNQLMGASANDYVIQAKEMTSKGIATADRLERQDKEGPMRVTQYTQVGHNAPWIALSNAPEGRGNPPMLDRFLKCYANRVIRKFSNPAKFRNMTESMKLQDPRTREITLVHTLLMILTKMQECNIIPWPSTVPFAVFMKDFMKETADNPFLKCAELTESTRKYKTMELMYFQYVNHMLLTRYFVDKTGYFTGKPFHVSQLLALAPCMAAGDTQAAIFAAGCFSHEMVSPVYTEVRTRMLEWGGITAAGAQPQNGDQENAMSSLATDARRQEMIASHYSFVGSFSVSKKGNNVDASEMAKMFAAKLDKPKSHSELLLTHIVEALTRMQSEVRNTQPVLTPVTDACGWFAPGCASGRW